MIGLGGVSCARAPYTKTNMLRATRYTRFACYKVHKGYSCVQHVPQGVASPKKQRRRQGHETKRQRDKGRARDTGRVGDKREAARQRQGASARQRNRTWSV